MNTEKRGRELYRNTVSYFGGLIVLISVALIVLFLLLSFGLSNPGPYIGIFTYIVFPGFFTVGVLIFLYGLRRENRRRLKLGTVEALPYPVLDLNDLRQRKQFTLALIGGSLILILLSYLGYNAYLFTDSVSFCGKLCHSIMKPEYTAYLDGQHARVPCVDCHVGQGVSWYVKSKISGVPQVFATIFGTYSAPIPTPIKNLRPARETCEKCHWPQKFYDAKLAQNPYFRYDRQNTPEQISLLIKTGGGSANLGENAGIHWHMIEGNKVYFRATDRELQRIIWVKTALNDGSVIVYRDRDSNIPDNEVEKLPLHSIDCMDCHNRPTHIFQPPENAVNRSMERKEISPKLPWIKRLAVDVLLKKYRYRENAHREIREMISRYYKMNLPTLSEEQPRIEQAIEAIEAIYDRNAFSRMHVDWTTYPDNIGHRDWPGCFRCHDGRHETQSGKTIRNLCSLCHTIPQRGPLMPLGVATPVTKESWHPWLLKGGHATLLCNRCHRAGYSPPVECASCHGIDRSAPMMSMKCSRCHLKEQEVEPVADCRSCHHILSNWHGKEGHSEIECTTCHVSHRWMVISRDACLTCHEDKKSHYAPTLCWECHR